jgi:hypothetical protein
MRALASITVLGTLALAGGVYAQSLTEHAAAAAGATIGTAAGKPISNALSGIFSQVDQSAATAAATGNKAKVVKTTIAPDGSGQINRGGAPGSFSPGFVVGGSDTGDDASSQQPGSRRRSAPGKAMAASFTAIPVPAAPVKVPSREEVASVQLGTTEKDLFATLGPPESHVSVPDDDGHMRESCQFWANGKQLGTIKLDNGQVVKVDVRGE